MAVSNLKKELKKLDKDKLVDLISDLYKKNKSVKEFLDFYVNPNEDEQFMKYKDKVIQAFFPKRGDRYSISDGKKAISDFKKLEPSQVLLADLMLCYVETGVKFTNEFGDINEQFYNSMASTFLNAAKIMHKENIMENFEDRVNVIIKDTEKVGWGFHDDLSSIWDDYISM